MIEYYAVQQGRYWAVRRRGVKGGTRHVAVYTDKGVAEHIASTLNLFSDSEA